LDILIVDEEINYTCFFKGCKAGIQNQLGMIP